MCLLYTEYDPSGKIDLSPFGIRGSHARQVAYRAEQIEVVRNEADGIVSFPAGKFDSEPG